MRRSGSAKPAPAAPAKPARKADARPSEPAKPAEPKRRATTPEPAAPVATPAAPAGALPTDTFFGDQDEVYFNGEAVRLIHQPNAHTDGDVLVYFRKSDVVATGDLYTNTSYPVIDLTRGGTINGIIAGLNRILDITVPRDKQEGGTMVIPGHGRIADEADVVEYRDMVTIIRDRVQQMMKKGMTLEQVKAAKPTFDYDPLYGATTGFWTTDKFVDAVYASLAPKKK